jgi:hypothetical protein
MVQAKGQEGRVEETPGDAGMNTEQWLIWSNEHDAWWAHQSNGYTKQRSKAGRYTRQEAIEICEGANAGCWDVDEPSETMVRDQRTRP